MHQLLRPGEFGLHHLGRGLLVSAGEFGNLAVGSRSHPDAGRGEDPTEEDRWNRDARAEATPLGRETNDAEGNQNYGPGTDDADADAGGRVSYG